MHDRYRDIHHGSEHGHRERRGHDERFAREPGRHGPRHEHGGRGRVFDHGELRLVVLAMIAEQPRHGYELIRAIEDRLAGTYSPSPGVIYPTLTLLDQLGHVTVTESDGRKLHAITEAGHVWLAEHRPAVDAALARMDSVSASHGGGPAPQIVRAMENLKLSLRLRLARGPLTEGQLQAVAAALDQAAVTVERS